MNINKSKRFPILFSPIRIGNMMLPNRIVMAPMNPGLAESDGSFSLQEIDYYRTRAAGGVGLIITGMTRVDVEVEPIYKRAVNQALFPFHATRMAALSEMIHACGSKVALQLSPGLGRQSGSVFQDVPPVAASAVPAFSKPSLLCRELTVDEIKKIIQGCANAASMAYNTGFDAVEIHGHAGYLVDQFLSTVWNKRNDRYGGNVRSRCTFALEILEAVKKATNSMLPVIFRFSVDQKIPEGRSLDEARDIALHLQNGGYDALHCDAGCYDAMEWVFPTSFNEDGCMIDLAKAVKDVVSIPVIAVGNLRSPELAEDVLSDGKTDLVAIGRSLIADPKWPEKALKNQILDIRPCIKCNELCIGHIFSGLPISCSVNPEVSKESFSLRKKNRGKPKKVLVIGGGIAGMEAARAASSMGHTVKLVEKNTSLGGQLIAASNPSFKSELRELLSYYIYQMDKLVKLETGLSVSSEMVNEFQPDHIIVATGAKPLVPELDGLHLIPFETAYEYHLSKTSYNANHIIIVGGGIVGCETALDAAQKGHCVTVIEMMSKIAKDLNPVSRMALLEQKNKKKVTILTNYKVVRFSTEGVVTLNFKNNKKTIYADKVIFALGAIPDHAIMELLKESNIPYSCIGDCEQPGKIGKAIRQGFYAALYLDF